MPVLLRLMNSTKGATDDPIPVTTSRGPMVEWAFGHVAITQVVVSTPDPTVAPRTMVVADKRAKIAKRKKKMQWQDVPIPLRSPERRKTGAKQPDWAPVSLIPSQVEERGG
ncbi:hypothetical protein R1flu_011122 [Riccia fluitans]|uniref:Uncharacterized protein n=1 Tax=Riccia fluitans TaxID=41844 RepID=A0ABD1Z7Q2_9MARC